MELNAEGLKDSQWWGEKRYRLPEFDRKKMEQATKEKPYWIHFGAGNIFRAFQANVVQKLLNNGVLDRGLLVAEGFDYEIVERMYWPHDNFSILATLKTDGTVEKTVIGSIAEALVLDSENTAQFSRLEDIFRQDSLQMASFTITEKGYSLVNGSGELLQEAVYDLDNGPGRPQSYMGKITALLYTRFLAGKKPIAMVSMDNCSKNGDRLLEAVRSFAEKWADNGQVDKEFLSYVADGDRVTFPWTMIDKITPRPDDSVGSMLVKDGIRGLEPVITSKNSYAAPFVNAEETEYLVIEDSFPNGRPALEEGGLIFTDRITVSKAEQMKVCSCLNPLHTALAIFGCLLGYSRLCEEMEDPELKKLVERIGYVEGLPAVTDPGILAPKEFMDTVLNVRIANPFMPDTPQRIATDTSQKLGIRFGETIKAYLSSESLDINSLVGIPLVFAGWLRYLTGVDDNGAFIDLSPDPFAKEISSRLRAINWKSGEKVEEGLLPIYRMSGVWGIDLAEAGLDEKVSMYMKEMSTGAGAVRRTLKKYLDN
ncbi:MAG: mannitol dehydrogenase family protein [Lachnospiraceae bacterium]|nr:mannitol dehydrogenase family protein [Lachnospiraceae bacterium]